MGSGIQRICNLDGERVNTFIIDMNSDFDEAKRDYLRNKHNDMSEEYIRDGMTFAEKRRAVLLKSAYVAKKMGRHRSGVSRTFTKLMRHGIIHKIEDVDDAYVFDPYKAWRGDSLSHLRVALAIDRKNWDEIIKNGNMARRIEA